MGHPGCPWKGAQYCKWAWKGEQEEDLSWGRGRKDILGDRKDAATGDTGRETGM